ncbi:FMN-binding negative transcriptional regulator [uncultured Tenacibaculum sp.]|uniref:FMN-binding negative transcriptional regulator n=1 Tax=uncultured Tenacibaculum sp. TaxID=174713 RepID=UPI0026362313|nr:FMN-binding negative transcriptional regulator [uncultured Tenacibaculum sp.]
MYNIPSYKAKNEQEILDFINEYPFVQITGVNEEGKPVATQIPVIVEKRNDELYIIGHMMKETDHCKAFQKNSNVLSVFTGPNGYVSASWCVNSNKGSTWNYMSVHAEGKMSFFEGEKLVSLMKAFTLLHEKGNENSPTVYHNLPETYTNKWMPHITGFEIKVDRLDTVFKLSQGLDKESYLNVIAELEKRGGTNTFLASEMKKRVSELFSE